MTDDGAGAAWYEELPRSGRIYQLIEQSSIDHKEIRVQALKFLGESGDPRAVRPLIELTNDKDAEIRRYATEGLLKLRSPRGVDALHARFKDKTEERDTRKIAADALGDIGSYHATEILFECLQDSSEDSSIREYVAKILVRTNRSLPTEPL